jgi:hypothetical protein
MDAGNQAHNAKKELTQAVRVIQLVHDIKKVQY